MLLSLLNVYIDIRMLVQLVSGVCGNWKIRGFSTSSDVHLGPLINVLAVLDYFWLLFDNFDDFDNRDKLDNFDNFSYHFDN